MALVLMAYGIGLAFGEAVRERVFGGYGSYWLYSDQTKLRVKVSHKDVREIIERSLSLFPWLTLPTHA